MALIILNSFMIYKTVYKQKFALKHTSELSNRKKRQMTISVIILTMLFIIMTLPGAVVSGYFFQVLIKTPMGTIILYLLDNISFSYHGLGFLILYLSNKQISMQVKSLIYRIRNKNLVMDTESFRGSRSTAI